MTFFLVADGTLHLPQNAEPGAPAPGLDQHRQGGYLPVVVTTYQPPIGVEIEPAHPEAPVVRRAKTRCRS